MDLSSVPWYDHHAHAVFSEEFWRRGGIEPYFSEATDPQILSTHTPHNLFFRRSVRDLAEFYGCEAERSAVETARRRWDYLELNRAMFGASNISALLIDDGIWRGRLWTVAESAARLPVPVGRILRIETELEDLLPQSRTAAELLDALEALLRREAPGLSGLKSILAYRTGLEIQTHAQAEVDRAFETAQRDRAAGHTRLNLKPLLDTALRRSLTVAHDTGLPVQFHIGYGDPDLDLRLANPLHLRPIFEDPELRGLNVVLLHCYPYVREAGYLAAVYPGAWLDLGLSVPHLSVDGMRRAVHEALHLAPVSKVLLSTDAQRTPELFWLACRWGRRVLGQVLGETVQNGDLSAAEADWAAARLLHGNAENLYPVGRLSVPTLHPGPSVQGAQHD